MSTVITEPQTENKWLRAPASGRPIGVDRELKTINGFVVAQAGPFKSEGRGEFDGKSLSMIRRQINATPKGLKSRFTHPNLSSDGLGKFLGRASGAFQDTLILERGGEKVAVEAVRANLKFSDSAFNTPGGDLATYVMDLAESDPDALSSSLVLETDEEIRLDAKGRRATDVDGRELPPLWRPTKLHASDIVDVGDAVDGLLSAQLSADGLPDEIVRKAAAMLREQFGGKPREFVEPRLNAWVERVLSHYWPVELADKSDEEAAAAELARLELELLEREYSR